MDTQLPTAQPPISPNPVAPVAGQVTNTPPPVVPSALPAQVAAKVDKFPDPLDKNPPIVVGSTQEPVQMVNKNFWKVVLLFLVLLPIVSGIGVFVYQQYLNRSLSTTPVQQKPVVIDPSLVVTPETLPVASVSADVLPGWKKYMHADTGFSFQYPATWFLTEIDKNQVKVQSFDPKSTTQEIGRVTFQFTLIPSNTLQSSVGQLPQFAKKLDTDQAIRITTVSESVQTSAQGLEVYQRVINKGSDPTEYREAYFALDKNVLQLVTTGEISYVSPVFDQMLKTVSVSQVNSASQTNSWQEYSNSHGYTLKYPQEILLKSNDKEEPGLGDVTKAISVKIFPIKDIENVNGFGNLLTLVLSDTEPAQTGTQSATRDFGNREFKVYTTDNSSSYVGQLPTGNWLEIQQRFDSNIDQRKLLNQVVDTITLKEEVALP